MPDSDRTAPRLRDRSSDPGRPLEDPSRTGTPLEAHVAELGTELTAAFTELLACLPDVPRRPQPLADALGVDKVLTSRLLKSIQSNDPIAAIHRAPGPAPLRRVARGAAKAGVDEQHVARAVAAIDAFEHLVKVELGDRGYLDAILSAWVPEARDEFELRSKQAAWRATSQLLGTTAETLYSAAILAPSSGVDDHIDVAWLIGVYGLRRLRPGARVRISTRRVTGGDAPRRPRTLDGAEVDGTDVEGLRLDRYLEDSRAARLAVERVGDAFHYNLAGEEFGPGSEADLLIGEFNRAELPSVVAEGSGRRGYFFAEVAPPARRLVLDLLVHEDVYPGSIPELAIYDTTFEGIANVNDPTRDADLLDLSETVLSLGRGLDRFRVTEVPSHPALLRDVFASASWDPARFRGFRTRIDFPVYGSQVALSFAVPER